MAYFSPEEDNYVRICLLLSGISPRAARNYFDYEFAPASLDATLKKQYNDLFELKKKHRINQSQWKLLFPTYPDTPDSKTFDITLMITLLRNLAKVTPPHKGFDCLPSQTEITKVADLARIKYFRNLIAHMDDGKIEKTDFNTAWENISGAIERLGGQQMKIECDELKTKILDPTNKEIMMNIKQARDEIKELNESLILLKRSHEVLKEDHAETTKKMEMLKAAQNDTVPWNVRARMKTKLQAWKDDDDMMFINTRAAQHVLKCLMENSCVTITASSGVGKTYTLRHVALQSAQEEYDVLVMTDPGDIVKFYNPEKKTLFVVDDLCGNFSVDQSDLKVWERIMDDIKRILEDKKAKIIAACRLQVYTDKKFENLSVFNSCVCNMSSEILALSIAEKQLIAEKYLKTKASEISSFYDLYDCFPLLCKLYHANPNLNVTDFFQNPFSVYEEEINNLRMKGHYTKYCALALCVMFNNNLKEEILTEDVKEETMTIIEKTCEVCNLPRGTSRNVLHDELDSLKDSFIKKEQNIYKVIHDKIFDFLTFIYGQQIIYCLIKQADSGLIKQRFAFEKTEDMDQFVIIIPKEYHQIYMQRMIEDWSKRKIQDVFSNINMNVPQFKHDFLSYLKSLDLSYQIQLAHTCDDQSHGESDADDEDDNDGGDDDDENEDDNDDDDDDDDADDVDDDDDDDADNDDDDVAAAADDVDDDDGLKYTREGCIGEGVDDKENGNREGAADKDDRSREFVDDKEDGNREGAADKDNRNREFVDDKDDGNGENVDYHEAVCNREVVVVEEYHNDKGVDGKEDDGKIEGVDETGENCNVCAVDVKEENGGNEEDVCEKENGNVEGVGDKEEDGNVEGVDEKKETGNVEGINEKKYDGNAVGVDNKEEDGNVEGVNEKKENGNEEGVDEKKDDGNVEGDDDEKTDDGNVEVVDQKKEDDNVEGVGVKSKNGNNNGESKFDNDDNAAAADDDAETVLLQCCLIGDISLVQWCWNLCVDVERCNCYGESPVMKACEYGHTVVATFLMDIGANYDRCDNDGQSPLMKASANGRTEIVKILLDKGVNYNKRDNDGESPIMLACEQGHPEIVRMLLHKGVKYNKRDDYGESPLFKACENGHTEIVRVLLDKGANYNNCDNGHQSPLFTACENGHSEIVKVLLDKGSDYEKRANGCQSPLMIACTHGATEIVKLLLDKGANFNKGNRKGECPVTLACDRGNFEIVEMLLDRGVSCNEYDVRRFEPLLTKACRLGHTKIVKMLLNRGANSSTIRQKWGDSPVNIACNSGSTEIVKILLDHGADYITCNCFKMSPVMTACTHGHTEIVNMLLDRGVCCNEFDDEGLSPVMMASKMGHTEIVKILLDTGVNFNECDNKGLSPLSHACLRGHTDIVKMLLERGVDYNICDNDGKTPVVKASEHGHTEIVKMLLNKNIDSQGK